MSDKTKIPELLDPDIGEFHIFAMYAWQDGVPKVQMDPEHVVALADAALVARQQLATSKADYTAALERIRELEAENATYAAHLKAEQASHATIVRKLSAAMGDYTGSWMDAAVERLTMYPVLKLQVSAVEAGEVCARADGEAAGRAAERSDVVAYGGARAVHHDSRGDDAEAEAIRTVLDGVVYSKHVGMGETESEASDVDAK